jgi:hypothetical protein
MAGSTNEELSVVDERTGNLTYARETIFANANNREPLLHGMGPSHKPWSKSRHSHQPGQRRFYYNW